MTIQELLEEINTVQHRLESLGDLTSQEAEDLMILLSELRKSLIHRLQHQVA